MRRFAVATVLAALAMMVLVMPGSAAIRWCRSDPIVRLGGVEYQIIVSVPAHDVAKVNGPLSFMITSAEGAGQEVLFADSGFNGYGETIQFQHYAGTANRISLTVPTTGDEFPVLMDVFRDGQKVASMRGTTSGVWYVDPTTNTSGDANSGGGAIGVTEGR